MENAQKESGGEPQHINSEDTITDAQLCMVKKSSGGWGPTSLLLVNQGLATLAFYGVAVNLVLFLTRVLKQSNAAAANNVSNWTGAVYFCSLIGAFLSDSYWGRYLTCALFQGILVLGLLLVSLSSWLILLNPVGCGDGKKICAPTTSLGSAIFYLAIYMIAFGYGGHQPTIATLGADQFNESNPKQKNSKASFFSLFYFALNAGCLISNSILVYYEDKGNWALGFGVATASAVLALVAFLLGSPCYIYVKASGNPIPRVFQVFAASVKKYNVALAEGQELYEVEGSESAIKGSRKILHSDELQFLDKAAIVTEQDLSSELNPWRLCTVTQVEEAKCIIRMLPIWIFTIIYSVVFTQVASLFVEQGDVMDCNVGRFHLPAASMTLFEIWSVFLFTGLYRWVIVPVTRRFTGNSNGMTVLQRMGIGIIISMLAMISAGLTEVERLRRVIPGERTSPMSVFWQIPQYSLVGASEVFMYVGQLEFFNGEAPDGLKSLGSSLCMASISIGNFVSAILVIIVMGITARNKQPGWIPEDLNRGHIDRFFFLIAALAAIDFVAYVVCAKWYKPINVEKAAEIEI